MPSLQPLIWNDLSSQLVCSSISVLCCSSRDDVQAGEQAPLNSGARAAGRVLTPSVGVPQFENTRHRWWPKELSRRLITLIFAGRYRIIVIRRELPRTISAGSVRRPTA